MKLNIWASQEDGVGYLTDQAKSQAPAYTLKDQILLLSHTGIEAVEGGKWDEVEAAKAEMKAAWKQMGDLFLPGNLHWEFEAEVGQEIAEFFAVAALAGYIVGRDPSPGEIPTATELDLTVQQWLYGLADVPGELSKILGGYLLQEDLSSADRIAARKRYLEVAGDIYKYLKSFLAIRRVSDRIRSNSNRKGFGNTFRGKVAQASRRVEDNRERLIDMLDRESQRGAK